MYNPSSSPFIFELPIEPQSSFHRFPELPTEIQMQVWRYAATPVGVLNINASMLQLILQMHEDRTVRYLLFSTFMSLPSVTRVARLAGLTPVGPPISQARRDMLQVCTLSRHIVWEAWKADVKAISVHAGLCHSVKADLVAMLDCLVKSSRGPRN